MGDQRGTLAIDMTGQTVAGWHVVRRVPTIARLARFLCKHTCAGGGQRYIEGSILRGNRAPKRCGDACKGAAVTDGRQRCPQCNDEKAWPEAFIGRRGQPIGWCSDCVELYRANGGTRATRRAKIDARASARVLWVPHSMDRKLGPMPATYSAGSTCPDACALKDQGCYAEFGKLGYHWSRVAERGLSWPDFLYEVACLPDGTLWRHNIAGDLQGAADRLDVGKLNDLALCNAGKRGFSFTHYPLRGASERAAVKAANADGFTVNLSADTLEHADQRAELDVGPVAVTLASDAPPHQRTPAGRHVVLCPAETNGLTCSSCQLCAQPQRKAIVGFRAHGQWSRRIDERLRLPVVQAVAS